MGKPWTITSPIFRSKLQGGWQTRCTPVEDLGAAGAVTRCTHLTPAMGLSLSFAPCRLILQLPISSLKTARSSLIDLRHRHPATERRFISRTPPRTIKAEQGSAKRWGGMVLTWRRRSLQRIPTSNPPVRSESITTTSPSARQTEAQEQ